MKTLFLIWLILLGSVVSASAYEQQGAIEGSVRDLQGNPISGATVYAYNTARMTGRFIRLTTISQSDGRFALRDLSPGSYRVHAYKESDGYADTFFAFFGTSNMNAWKNAEVQTGRTTLVALELGPKYARLKMSIRDERGSPVSAGLSFRKVAAPDAPYSVGVNAESELLVPPVPFRFEVSAKGYQPWKSGVLSPRSGETVEVSVRLTRSH